MIKTQRLKLIPYELKHFEAILNDQRSLGQLLGATVFDDWFLFLGVAGIGAIKYGYEYDPAGNCGKDCKVCKMWNEKMKRDSVATWKEIEEKKKSEHWQ